MALLAAMGCKKIGCKKDDKPDEKPAVPETQGQATEDLVATGVGNGLGMRPGRAPSSTTWDHVYVLDERRAILTGHALEKTYALFTEDRGQSWKILEASSEQWSSWGTDADGHVAVVVGVTKKGNYPDGQPRPVESGQAQFLTTVGDLTEPGPFFGEEGQGASKLALPSGIGRPAVLRQELASMVLFEGRNAKLGYAVPGGSDVPEAKDLPRGEWVTIPYGQPAQLLSVTGNSLAIRPWPQPDQAIPAQPTKTLNGIAGGRAAAERLSTGPHCDVGAWSFHRLEKSPGQAQIVGVSPAEQRLFDAPAGSQPVMGCTPEAIAIEVVDPEKKQPQLARCTLDGKCQLGGSPPFELWEGDHEREIMTTPTSSGVVAVMKAQQGPKWGVYLAVSNDGMKSFSLPRAIGEGEGGRGQFKPAALFTMGDRVVLILSAEVTGSNRRGFYTLVSDNGGLHFGPP